MPLPGVPFPRDQFDLLMRWIDEGAPNGVGAVAFTTYPEGRVMATNQAEDVVAVIDIRSRLVARYVQAGLPRVVPGLQPQSPHHCRKAEFMMSKGRRGPCLCWYSPVPRPWASSISTASPHSGQT